MSRRCCDDAWNPPSDLPVTLEALPEELEQLHSTPTRFVTVEWIRPGARKGERITVPIEDFSLLAGPGVMDNAIQDALISKHRSRSRAGETTRGAGAGGAGGPREGQLRHLGARRRAASRAHHRGREGTGPFASGRDQQSA